MDHIKIPKTCLTMYQFLNHHFSCLIKFQCDLRNRAIVMQLCSQHMKTINSQVMDLKNLHWAKNLPKELCYHKKSQLLETIQNKLSFFHYFLFAIIDNYDHVMKPTYRFNKFNSIALKFQITNDYNTLIYYNQLLKYNLKTITLIKFPKSQINSPIR